MNGEPVFFKLIPILYKRQDFQSSEIINILSVCLFVNNREAFLSANRSLTLLVNENTLKKQ